MDQQNSLVTQFQHTTHIHSGVKEMEIEHLASANCDVFHSLSAHITYDIAIVVSLLVRLVSRSLNSIEQPLFFSSFLFLQPNPMHRMNIPYLYRSNLVSWPLEPLRQHIGKSLLERSFALPCQTFPGRRGRPDLWEPSFCLFSLPPGPSLHPDADNKALFKKEAPTEQERSKSSF